uniref:Uncharacterized protein n=1 Tax=Solanum tuberosum TaxID=4113 RepID=M1C3S3_SOLTU
MDNKEDKSEISRSSIEEVDEHKATKSEEINNDQVIVDLPKIVTIESDAHTNAEQVKDEEKNNNDQVIIDPPKIVTIESEANIDAEQVKDEEENNSNPAENEQVEKDRMESSELVKINQIEKETKCRPIAFLLGLPFALISLVIAFIGGIIWIIGFVFL